MLMFGTCFYWLKKSDVVDKEVVKKDVHVELVGTLILVNLLKNRL